MSNLLQYRRSLATRRICLVSPRAVITLASRSHHRGEQSCAMAFASGTRMHCYVGRALAFVIERLRQLGVVAEADLIVYPKAD